MAVQQEGGPAAHHGDSMLKARRHARSTRPAASGSLHHAPNARRGSCCNELPQCHLWCVTLASPRDFIGIPQPRPLRLKAVSGKLRASQSNSNRSVLTPVAQMQDPRIKDAYHRVFFRYQRLFGVGTTVSPPTVIRQLHEDILVFTLHNARGCGTVRPAPFQLAEAFQPGAATTVASSRAKCSAAPPPRATPRPVAAAAAHTAQA